MASGQGVLSAAQIRAARGLLDWTREQLVGASGISMSALTKIEGSKSMPQAETLASIKRALENAGVVFGDSDGVKLKHEIVTVFEGAEGIKEFFDDAYIAATRDEREFLISGVQQNDFYETLGVEYMRMHVERLRRLPHFKIKGIKAESAMAEPVLSYTEYRYLPDQMFVGLPFYVYADKLAIIIWQDKRIFCLHDARVADAYRQQFSTLWRIAKRPQAAPEMLDKKYLEADDAAT